MGVCILVCLQSTFSAHCCACVRNVVVSGLRIKSLRHVHTMNTLCIGYTLFGFTLNVHQPQFILNLLSISPFP